MADGDVVPITPGSGQGVGVDKVTSVNGTTVASEAIQRVKVGYGATGTFIDASSANPLPVLATIGSDPDTVVTGNITANDGTGAAPSTVGAFYSTAPVASSFVAAQCPGGESTWDLQVIGTFGGGSVYFEGSLDSTNGSDGNWQALNGRQTGQVNTVLGTSMATAGLFRGNTSGVKWMRARVLGATAPSLAVLWRLSAGIGPVFLNASLPGGTNTIGAVTLTSAVGAINGRPDGFLNFRQDPTSLLFDTFETLDTTNTWTLGGTVVPTGAGGVANAAPGTAASATSTARSKPAFTPTASAYLQYASIVTINAALLTGVTRYWGLGVPAAAPTTGVPVQDGTVFETRAADGLLYGSVYSAGALTQSVALTRPTDGTVHRYQIIYKASRVYFQIDNVDVGSLLFPNPTVSALPVIFGAINGAAILGTAPQLALTLAGVGDTGKNSVQLADGTYAWRKLLISAAGRAAVDASDVPHDAANSTNTVQIGGQSSPADVPPTLVAAVGNRTRIWADRAGAQVTRRRRLRDSYTAIFRLQETAARMDLAFITAANTNKQVATLHHLAASTKDVWIQKIQVAPIAFTIATQAIWELRYISTAPATGNPAITPARHHQGAAVSECTALALPTTGGTDPNPNSPLAASYEDVGITGAAPTTNPPAGSPWVDLYNAGAEDDIEIPLVLRAGVLEGIAVNLRTVAAVTTPGVRFMVLMRWTEETP